jgi:putative ABC transport system permease protein
MHMNPGYSWNYTNMVLKLNSGDISATMALLDDAWNKVFPERPFEWNFLDDQLESNYRKEMVFASIFKSFAFIAIAVSCLGLLGLVSFSVERKSKEIGVRKVLGASVSSILVLVSREFSKLIIIGFAIAVPFAYFFLEEWLQGFKYRIDIGFSAFLIAGLVTLLVAWLATGYTSFRAARANPVESLRSE